MITRILTTFSIGIVSCSVFAQCDITLPRAQYITCLSLQQQQQTGVYPHQSQFQAPVLQAPQPMYQQPAPVYQAPSPVYQSPQPIYQQPAPQYQQPPSQWVPSNRSSTYR